MHYCSDYVIVIKDGIINYTTYRLNLEAEVLETCHYSLKLKSIPIENLADLTIEVSVFGGLTTTMYILQDTVQLGETVYRCTHEGCHRLFSCQQHLCRHRLSHTDKHRHQCDNCDFATSRRDVLTRHQKARHNIHNVCDQDVTQHAKSPGLYCETHNIHFSSYQNKSHHYRISQYRLSQEY